MHTTWRTRGDSAQFLDLLQQRLATAEDVTAVDRAAGTLVVRSRAVPTWAYLLSVVLTPLPIKPALLRARSDRVLRITATNDARDPVLRLDGDANAAVSRVLVTTSHELYPDRVGAWDDE